MDEKYSRESMVNNIVITLYGNYTYRGEHFVMYTNVKSLCCTPVSAIILYVIYTSIHK